MSSKPSDKQASRLPDVVLVTGSSSGIGRACCDRLADGGRRVYGASRTPGDAARWTYVAMDVTDDASVARAVDEVVRREGRIDALVHCAGISIAGSFEDTTVEEANRQFDTNFFGAVRVVRAVLPVMRKQGAGKLIVVGSIGGLMGLPYIGYYSASKFALDGLVQALRMEIRPFGIEATVVHPGDFNTAISANQILCANANADSAYFAACQRTIEIYDTNVKQRALGRCGGPQDRALAVAPAAARALRARHADRGPGRVAEVRPAVAKLRVPVPQVLQALSRQPPQH